MKSLRVNYPLKYPKPHPKHQSVKETEAEKAQTVMEKAAEMEEAILVVTPEAVILEVVETVAEAAMAAEAETNKPNTLI